MFWKMPYFNNGHNVFHVSLWKLQARFTQDFSKCVGVEILKSLHDAGMEVVDRYNKYFKEYLHSNQVQDRI